MTKRRRSSDARRVFFGLANIFSSVFETIERVEEGEDILSAGSRAIRDGKRRARALSKAEPQEQKDQEPEPTVIDAEIEEP